MMGWVMSHRSLFLCFNTGLKSSATLLTKFSQSWNTYRRSIIWFQFHPLVTPLSPLPRSCLKTGIKKSFIYDFEMHTLSLESILWFISPACWFFILKKWQFVTAIATDHTIHHSSSLPFHSYLVNKSSPSQIAYPTQWINFTVFSLVLGIFSVFFKSFIHLFILKVFMYCVRQSWLFVSFVIAWIRSERMP